VVVVDDLDVHVDVIVDVIVDVDEFPLSPAPGGVKLTATDGAACPPAAWPRPAGHEAAPESGRMSDTLQQPVEQ
jgi:hypothetical protein